jgi:diguanylate cyclase (GGDEF)-like protein
MPGRCVAGRLGGEEFALVLRADEAELLGTAELIRRMIARLEFSNRERNLAWTCTASLGVFLQDRGQSLEHALEEADRALYRAKGEGRNRVLAA